ncbi:hypothetical protein Hypma_005115 [Hypsizygus marmoreus]|uniref:DUF6699 domain-containing protein n=1 Tax=Hypsizygus marmoreus TaxID=39966 RepID=A0A369K0A9_HYPMA|nr:hypothetical protein Hypma_005115 [Hypsizygus marmoreus]
MPFPLSTKYAQTSVPPLTRDAYYDVSLSYTRAARTHVARRSMVTTTTEAQPYWPPPSSTSAPEHHLQYINPNEASSSSRSSPTRWEPHSIKSPTSSRIAQTSLKTSPWSSAAPPPHSRPLYQTIPLPTEDTTDYAIAAAAPTTMSPTSPPPTTPWSMLLAPWPDSSPYANCQQFDHIKATSAQFNPIQLHPILERACLSSSLSVLNPLSQLSTDGAQDRSAPATNPSLGYLSIIITRYGATMPVHPSPSNPFVVTVGDVLDALYKVADIIMNEENDGQNVGGGGRGKKGERRSSGGWQGRTRVLGSLKLCWRTSTGNTGPGAGSHMGQLVVECR